MKSILIIEDTLDVSENLAEFLQMEGYSVQISMNGIEALDQLKTFSPNLIITDLRMPEMDGFVLLETLKFNNAFKSIPVIIFSANATVENKKKAIELGAHDFLTKPCHSEILLASIEKYIQ